MESVTGGPALPGAECATRLAERTGRYPQTVMGWVHAYNAQGPDALAFRRTGGRRPFFVRSAKPSLAR